MNDFDAIVGRYAEIYRDEAGSLSSVLAFLKKEPSPEARVDRSNYTGHITASCLLVDPGSRKILLFFHPYYQLLLQPGGHFANPEEDPLQAATRKLFEETPYRRDRIRQLPSDYDSLVPLDIDSHSIPANPSRGERHHVHHDFRYVFLASADESAVPGRTAGLVNQQSLLWYDLSELNRIKTFERLYPKLQEFLSQDSARRRFFLGLASRFPMDAKVNTLVVTHVLPDAFDFLDLLRRQTRLIGVVPKPKSLHIPTRNRLEECGIEIFDLDRDEVASKLPELLDRGNPEAKTVLLDIGGWFASALRAIPQLSDRLLGVVEDTRNGQNKYEQVAATGSFPVPIISVAESHLKENEDFLVGQSVVFSADVLLRECGLVLEYLECGVIGYGKIGRSIAKHLQERGLRPFVVEVDPLRRLTAFRERCEIRHRDWVNRSVDVLFCATGKQATDIIDFRSLKPGAFVFSVTSSDDEFDLDLLAQEYRRREVSKYVSRYDGSHNHFYLANDGNAVNFLHNAVLWEFIQLVKGGIYLCLRNLVNDERMARVFPDAEEKGGLAAFWELTREQESSIAELWMETVLLGARLED